MKPTLYFVYNVDLNPKALLQDFIHRYLSPETYPCKLCDITYGRFLKKKVWQHYIKKLPIKSRFYTKDCFKKKFPQFKDEKFPLIAYRDTAGQLSVLMPQAQLDQVGNLEALMALLEKALNSSVTTV